MLWRLAGNAVEDGYAVEVGNAVEAGDAEVVWCWTLLAANQLLCLYPLIVCLHLNVCRISAEQLRKLPRRMILHFASPTLRVRLSSLLWRR